MNYLKFAFLGVVFFSVFSQSEAQKSTSKDSSPVKLEWGGFIKSDVYYDSRKYAGAVEGLFNFYPLSEKIDAKGNDINDQGKLSLLALSSRLNAKISGPDILGAKTYAFVEFDFTGISSTTGLRLRHAYVNFDWEKTSILFGRYWHPLFVTDAFPGVMSLNTGAPFTMFNRSPQLRLKYNFTPEFQMITSLVSQSTSLNLGPVSGSFQVQKSPEFLKNAGVPNLNIRLQYKTANVLVGIAGDYKLLKPRQYTNSLVSENDSLFTTGETVSSFAIMPYFNFKSDKLTVKGRVSYGQNLTDHLMLGGYAVKSFDPVTGAEEYTPYNHLSSWLNIIYGKRFKIGLFGGYTQNLGTSDLVVRKTDFPEYDGLNFIYARGSDIAHIWRVSPTVYYRSGSMMFSLENEYTVAAYGNIDYSDNNLVKNTKAFSNNRIMFTMFYFF